MQLSTEPQEAQKRLESLLDQLGEELSRMKGQSQVRGVLPGRLQLLRPSFVKNSLQNLFKVCVLEYMLGAEGALMLFTGLG